MQNFYIHLKKSDWSSCNQKMAESDGSKSKIVSIEAVSFIDLCETFGVPRYLKVDIEGCDLIVAKQLSSLENKPQFVSFETSKRNYAEIFSWLFVAGYEKFQLVNQLKNINRKPEDAQESFEGNQIEYKFTQYSSGFFGNDLPGNKWLSYDEALTRYIKYKDLKIIDNEELGLGWLDVHACLIK